MFKDNDGHPIKNPVIHFDELDKIFQKNNRDSPETVFYAILEKNTSKRFYDQFIDASGINYIFTANTVESIPAPFLSRLKVFNIEEYTKEQLFTVLDSFYKTWLDSNNMQVEFLPEQLDEEIKESILEISENDTRSINDAIETIYEQMMIMDKNCSKPIALFSSRQKKYSQRKMETT